MSNEIPLHFRLNENGKNPLSNHVESLHIYFSVEMLFAFFLSSSNLRKTLSSATTTFPRCFVDENCFCHTFLLLSNIWLANIILEKKNLRVRPYVMDWGIDLLEKWSLNYVS